MEWKSWKGNGKAFMTTNEASVLSWAYLASSGLGWSVSISTGCSVV